MKTPILYLLAALALVGFSGCSSNTRMIQLQNQSMHQSMIIQQQQQRIDMLEAKLKKLAEQKRIQRAKRTSHVYTKPKKQITLKKVEDRNYSSDYMYPDDKRKQHKSAPIASAATGTMNKAECIAMIGQEKFDRYTQMFGSEAAAIKRCTMIRAMQK